MRRAAVNGLIGIIAMPYIVGLMIAIINVANMYELFRYENTNM